MGSLAGAFVKSLGQLGSNWGAARTQVNDEQRKAALLNLEKVRTDLATQQVGLESRRVATAEAAEKRLENVAEDNGVAFGKPIPQSDGTAIQPRTTKDGSRFLAPLVIPKVYVHGPLVDADHAIDSLKESGQWTPEREREIRDNALKSLGVNGPNIVHNTIDDPASKTGKSEQYVDLSRPVGDPYRIYATIQGVNPGSTAQDSTTTNTSFDPITGLSTTNVSRTTHSPAAGSTTPGRGASSTTRVPLPQAGPAAAPAPGSVVDTPALRAMAAQWADSGVKPPAKYQPVVAMLMKSLNMEPKEKKQQAAAISQAEQGLAVLQVSLFGGPDETGKQQPGLASVVGVLDDPNSRSRMAAVMAPPNQEPGMIAGISRVIHGRLYNHLTQPEQMFLAQFNRAVSAIQILRNITGNPRSTQQLMDRFIQELPNPVTSTSSAMARNKIQLIDREIKAARGAVDKMFGSEINPASLSTVGGDDIQFTPEATTP